MSVAVDDPLFCIRAAALTPSLHSEYANTTIIHLRSLWLDLRDLKIEVITLFSYRFISHTV